MSHMSLGVFAKWPEPGKVKTRLATRLGEELAARIAEAFLKDTLLRLSEVSHFDSSYLVYAPSTHESQFASLDLQDFQLEPQSEGDLGQRLNQFMRRRFDEGADTVMVLGTDSTTMPIGMSDLALLRLNHSEVVLGPATDGGYYLVCCRNYSPTLFENIDWSTASVLAQTVKRILELNWTLALLPPWYDVDTPEEWQMLLGHLEAHDATGQPLQVPHLQTLIRELNL